MYWLKCIFWGIFIFCVSCRHNTIEEKSPTSAQPISHQLWEKLLQKHVSEEGNVRYLGFQQDRALLEEYLTLLSSAHPDHSWSEAERKAYWINAYNAFTVRLILEHYPVKSIRNISSPWETKFITIESKKYNLNDIEHQILRPIFKDPRIHFAINCASYSCPKLWNKAITAKNIETELDALSREFINDPKRNILTAEKIQISEIFKWFQEDFVREQSLIDFLNQYAKTTIKPDARIEYLEYNWSLNE